jgi:RNA polymerase sigma-70 factor, ECF subfamily
LASAPMDSPNSDHALMAAVQRGDTSAFEQLLVKYNRAIVNFIYKFVNDVGVAEELAQEVFLKIYLARHTYEPRAPFSSWLYRIAANEGMRAARKGRRLFFRTRRQDADGHGNALEAIPDIRQNAEHKLTDNETARIVQKAIGSLPKKEKLAIVLRRYEGLSYEEIAGVMNCTEGAVKTYIHRGKLHLRDLMLPYIEKGLI